MVPAHLRMQMPWLIRGMFLCCSRRLRTGRPSWRLRIAESYAVRYSGRSRLPRSVLRRSASACCDPYVDPCLFGCTREIITSTGMLHDLSDPRRRSTGKIRFGTSAGVRSASSLHLLYSGLFSLWVQSYAVVLYMVVLRIVLRIVLSYSTSTA